MKKFTAIILSLCVIISLIATLPIIHAEEMKQFGLVNELSDGKEYVLIWNSSTSDNTGEKYALAESSGVFGGNKLNESYFSGDIIKLNPNYKQYIWIAYEENGKWRFECTLNGKYLAYDADTENGLVLSDDNTKDDTLWIYKKSSAGNYLVPSSKTTHRIRYSGSSECILVQSSSSNIYVYLYELGAEACPEHVYVNCLDTTCESCGNKSRSNSELAHVYSSDSDDTCKICGFEKHVFSDSELDENEASKTVSAVFYGDSSSSHVIENYRNKFNITSLISSIAPLKNVTHVDVTVEASEIKGISNKIPGCRVYYNGWQQKLIEAKTFEGTDSLSFSIDIPEENVESIWINPYSFETEYEFGFKITVDVTYVEEDDEPNYGEPLASIVSFSDFQLWTSDNQLFGTNWRELKYQLGSIFEAMSKRVNPDYIIFGGDYTNEVNNEAASEMGRSEVLDVISDWWPHIDGENGRYIQVKGNHDPKEFEGIVESGPIEFDNVIVYVIQENDFPCGMSSEESKITVETTAKTLEKYLNQRIRSGDTRPIIIATHLGLHYEARTGSNTQYIYILFDVINKAAEDLDIIFMHGHFHSSGDPEGGGGIVYRGVGETLNVADESCFDEEGKALQDKAGRGRPSVLNFTYMNYGYVGFVGRSDLEIFSHLETETVLTASELNVYDDLITLSRYSASGKISEFSKTIQRLHADAKPKLLPGDYIYIYIGIAVIIVIAVIIIIVVVSKKRKKNK